MDLRYVEEVDQLRQALLEIYVAVVLRTHTTTSLPISGFREADLWFLTQQEQPRQPEGKCILPDGTSARYHCN